MIKKHDAHHVLLNILLSYLPEIVSIVNNINEIRFTEHEEDITSLRFLSAAHRFTAGAATTTTTTAGYFNAY